jgi:plastocyanin
VVSKPPVVTPPSVSQPPAPPSGGTQTQNAAIAIQNFAFDPQTKTVAKGTTVTWTNNDSVPHQIKSASFNSGILAQGQSYSFTFNGIGSFAYSCSIHPSMTGTIIVQ